MLDHRRLKNREFPKNAARRILTLTSARALQSSGLDQIDEHHINAVIMEFLRRSFFDQVFYCLLATGAERNDVTPIFSLVEQDCSRKQNSICVVSVILIEEETVVTEPVAMVKANSFPERKVVRESM
jgi:hypothetical protein